MTGDYRIYFYPLKELSNLLELSLTFSKKPMNADGLPVSDLAAQRLIYLTRRDNLLRSVSVRLT